MIIRCIPWLPDTTFFHPDFRPPARDSRDDTDKAGRWSPRIRLQPQCEQVSEAERRCNMQPVVELQPHADCEHRRHEAFQRLGGARQRRVGRTTAILSAMAPRRPDPQWPDGARIAINIYVNFEGGGEKSAGHVAELS